MLINLLCWLWIAVSAFAFGMAGLGILKRINGYGRKELDEIVIFGVCLLTVYAQFFSLFYKVSGKATVLLAVLNIILIWMFRKDILQMISAWKTNAAVKYVILVTVLLTIAYLNYAGIPIRHYDTDLYHAQSIRWIEQFGVVPGLGNLHNRFAYNSSIFCLQALFSFRFLLGYSLHSINGFLGLIFMIYALCSLKVLRTHRFHVSDFFRVGLIFYIVSQTDSLSSPGSDCFTICMIFYILIKWIALLEEGITEPSAYILLCLMSVFAVSIKLTSAMLVILALAPAVRLVRQRRWKEIAIYVGFGAVLIIPFLIRNVIISGYLVYPFPKLDIFCFDWKMPQFTALFDKNEIKAWGMGLNDYAKYNAPFREWFPVWKQGLSNLEMLEIYSLPFTVVVSFGIAVHRTVKEKRADWLCVTITMLAVLLLWFSSAPLLRYGGIFLLLFPCFFVGTIMEKLGSNMKARRLPLFIMIMLIIYNGYPAVRSLMKSDWDHLIVGIDYQTVECREVLLGTEKFYVPAKGDQTGYYAFPATPYEAQLNIIEMRGDSLKDGFRIKDEYKDCFISNSGYIYEENVFE